MGLPREVQRQIDEANDIQKDIIAGKTAEAEPTDTEKKPLDEKAKKLEVSKEADSFLNPASKDDVSVTEIEKLKNEVQHANKRLNDFKKLHDESVVSSKAAIAKLEQENTELKNKVAEKPKAEVKDYSNDSDLIREAREDFGDDAVDAIIRSIKSDIQPLNEVIKPNKAEEQSDLANSNENTDVSQVSRDVFDYLYAFDSSVDWKKLNTHEPFLNYLNEENGLRNSAMQQAFANGRHIEVANFFINFISNKKRLVEEKENDIPVMPDGPSNGGDDTMPQEALYTWDQYHAEKVKITKGHYSQEAANALNLKLDGAVRDGRII